MLKNLLNYYPILIAWAVNGGLAVLLGSVAHISSTQEASVTTIVTALVVIFTMWKTREFAINGFVGALSTIAIAAGAFGLHLSSAEIGAAAAVLSGVLALLLHQSVTQAALVRTVNAPVQPFKVFDTLNK
jgi:hypothetical protein